MAKISLRAVGGLSSNLLRRPVANRAEDLARMGCFAIGSRRTACTDALEDGKRQRRLPCFGSHRSQSVTGEIRADSQTALRPRQRHGESQPPVARLEHRTGLTDSQPYFPRAETAQIRRLCLRILAEGRDSGIQDRSLHADHLSIELTTKSSFVPYIQENIGGR